MIYLLGVLIAGLLVLGQSLWKAGSSDISKISFVESPINFLSAYINIKVLLGLLVYGVTTVLYIWLLSKHKYSTLQAVIIPASLILTFFVASSYFKEEITATNILGLGLIVIGVWFATWH